MFFSTTILTATAGNLFAQNVLVTDDSNYVVKSSAVLDIKSSNKGLLMPRVNLASTLSALPITSPDSSLMVYNKATAGDVTPGYYFWNGAKWVRMANGQGGLNVVTKTATTTLLQTETMVVASNNITLTLPAITSADDGLSISVKNVGICTDLIIVMPGGGSTVDGDGVSYITRWKGRTYVAVGGNWLVKEKEYREDNVFCIADKGSWTTIAEMLAYLNMHMTAPSIVKLGGQTDLISATQVINLPYSVTFEGQSYGQSTIAAAAGVSGTPLFTCQTECYFKMILFTAFSNTAGNDAIRFTGTGKYYEVKDCSFDGFNKGIVSTTNNDLWVFDSDFENCPGAGIEIAAGAASGGSFKISECDFTSCAKGINLLSGVGETVSILNTTFYNTASGSDIGILYTPATFTTFANMFITGTAWNNEGTYISGFDFSLASGRDANAVLINNTGMEDEKPHCKIAVANNAATTTVTTNGTFYKASWAANTSTYSCKWTIGSTSPASGNRILYQAKNVRDGWAVITGDLSNSGINHVVTIAIVKNGVTATRYGEADLRITIQNQPFQFSTVVYIPGLKQGDYLELYVTSNTNGDIVTFQDVQWFMNTQ
jgi:hypothetical protein